MPIVTRSSTGALKDSRYNQINFNYRKARAIYYSDPPIDIATYFNKNELFLNDDIENEIGQFLSDIMVLDQLKYAVPVKYSQFLKDPVLSEIKQLNLNRLKNKFREEFGTLAGKSKSKNKSKNKSKSKSKSKGKGKGKSKRKRF